MDYVKHRQATLGELREFKSDEVNAVGEDIEPTVPVSRLQIWKKTWKVMLAIFVIFVTSLSVFPALTVEMHSSILKENGWYPLLLIVSRIR